MFMVIAMVNKYFKGEVENRVVSLTPEIDANLKEVVKSAYAKVAKNINDLKISDALSEVMAIFRRANKYIDETCPWVLAKDPANEKYLETVLFNLCEAIIVGTTLLEPFMPETAQKVAKMFNTKLRTVEEVSNFAVVDEYKVTDAPEVLFPRFDIKEIQAKAEQIKAEQIKEFNKENTVKVEEVKKGKEIIEFDAFEKVELKVGTILNSEKVEGSDKLLKNTVKLGEEVRTIVSGIAKLINQKILLVNKLLL